MRVVLRAAMLCLLFASGAEAAPNTAGEDKKTIQACLDKLEGELGTTCIGIVADPCIKAATGKNEDVVRSNACAARELVVWQAQMAEALKRVKAGGFKKVIDAVTQSQTTWQASHQKLCPAFDVIEPGMMLGAANYCRLHETARRALLLRRLGDAVNEH